VPATEINTIMLLMTEDIMGKKLDHVHFFPELCESEG
jgi:hypothetical protein